jgi:hypothetical protein
LGRKCLFKRLLMNVTMTRGLTRTYTSLMALRNTRPFANQATEGAPTPAVLDWGVLAAPAPARIATYLTISAGQEPHGEASDDDFRRIYRAEKERWAEVADRLK